MERPDDKMLSRHRFDNYGAWVALEKRREAKARGEHPGYGFSIPRPPAPMREEKPFEVMEAAFTSGRLVRRKYDQLDASYPSETVRADPHHYPNHQMVQESQHYEDRRARSCHEDPRARPVLPIDKELSKLVQEDVVKARIKAIKAENNTYPVNREVADIMMKTDIRPVAEHVQDLNVDMSCMELPARERPSSRSRGGSAALGSSHGSALGGDAKDRWGWCLGGRKPFVMPGHSQEEQALYKVKSTPQLITGKTFIPGKTHEERPEPSHFHGVLWDKSQSRVFGLQAFNGRMRGGPHAEKGFSGTFPSRELRPGLS